MHRKFQNLSESDIQELRHQVRRLAARLRSTRRAADEKGQARHARRQKDHPHESAERRRPARTQAQNSSPKTETRHHLRCFNFGPPRRGIHAAAGL